MENEGIIEITFCLIKELIDLFNLRHEKFSEDGEVILVKEFIIVESEISECFSSYDVKSRYENRENLNIDKLTKENAGLRNFQNVWSEIKTEMRNDWECKAEFNQTE